MDNTYQYKKPNTGITKKSTNVFQHISGTFVNLQFGNFQNFLETLFASL